MEKDLPIEEIVKIMVQKGVVFGHKKSKTHPKMCQYVVGNRNEIELLDPESSWKSVINAAEFLKEKTKDGGLLLLLGTKPASKQAIEEVGKEFGFPYVTNRWLGGTLTNFSVIKKRIEYYQKLKTKLEKGEFEKYTKKEQHKFREEIRKLSGFFEGLLSLKKVPDAILVVDAECHKTAIREANRLNIPVVAIIDTNNDPSPVDVPIIANDHSRESIVWVLDAIKKSLSPYSEKKSE